MHVCMHACMYVWDWVIPYALETGMMFWTIEVHSVLVVHST